MIQRKILELTLLRTQLNQQETQLGRHGRQGDQQKHCPRPMCFANRHADKVKTWSPIIAKVLWKWPVCKPRLIELNGGNYEQLFSLATR